MFIVYIATVDTVTAVVCYISATALQALWVRTDKIDLAERALQYALAGDQARSVCSSWSSCVVTRYPSLYWNPQRDLVRSEPQRKCRRLDYPLKTVAPVGARADGGFAGSVGSSAAYYAADSLAYDSRRTATHKHTKPVDRWQPQAVTFSAELEAHEVFAWKASLNTLCFALCFWQIQPQLRAGCNR